MSAADLCDARDLVLSCILEIDSVGCNAVTAGLKETVPRHPGPRGSAQIDTIGIVVTKFCLVTYDSNRHVVLPAAPEKSIDTCNHFRLRETFSVNVALQLLPRHLAIRKQPDRIADRLLSACEGRTNKAPHPRGSKKHGIVSDDRIVEVQPDAEAAAHFFAAMF